MDAWRMKLIARIYGKKLAYIGLISFLAISVYRLNELGAFKNNFRTFKPACGQVFGTLPLVGKSVREWAYGRGGSKKAVGKKKGKKSRRRR